MLWSLKEDAQKMLPADIDREQIFISKFIPQVEALNHPACGVAMLHCGMGATLEIISAGKPLLGWPGFGDQLFNADILVRTGMSLKLAGTLMKSAHVDLTKQEGMEIYWKDPCFTVEDFVDKTYRLLTEPSFTMAARKLQAISRLSGG